jgi:hypothetical protein
MNFISFSLFVILIFMVGILEQKQQPQGTWKWSLLAFYF